MTKEENVRRASTIIDWALTRPSSEWRTDPLPDGQGAVCVLLDNGYYGVNWVNVQPSEMELMEGARMVKWIPVPD